MDNITNIIPILLDTDPGCDDAVAIMLAALNPLIDLKAITVVAGNHTLENTFQNALKVCSALGIKNVPVAAGMSQPIVRKQVIAKHVHGETGLGNFKFGGSLLRPDSRHAVNLIIETLLNSNGEIVYTALGPLTNLAMAMRLEPKIIPKIKKIVMIGGSYQLGNITPAAEFNIYADPEAAQIVISCGRPIVMIGLCITEKVLATKEIVKRITAIGNKSAAFWLEFVDFYTKSNKELYNYEAPPIFDPAAIIYLINPAIFKTKPMYVEVELKSESAYGRTHCDYYGSLNKPANVDVVIDLDSVGFWKIIDDTIKVYG
jgi:ribosylpyrimidine nucleosidase